MILRLLLRLPLIISGFMAEIYLKIYKESWMRCLLVIFHARMFASRFLPSIVTESIFENRFKYVDELTRMGASIKVEGNTAIIDGVSRYTGASITAPDLRAGAALVLAGLSAEGITVVDNIHFIERGYEDFHLKLQSLGAQIALVNTERELQKFKLKIG